MGVGDESEWSPATSRPGELFTIEGRIRATGAFWRNAKRNDPRSLPYRRSMWAAALVCSGAAVVAVVIAVVIGFVF
jgi:hypothetical protein